MLEVKGKAEAGARLRGPARAAVAHPSRRRRRAAASRRTSAARTSFPMLRSHFEQAKAGRGQVVFVSGEAGIGKSRMLLEFQRSLADEDVTWLSGQCISYGRNIAYLPIADLLKRNFGVEEGDDEAAIVRRVDERASSWDEATRRRRAVRQVPAERRSRRRARRAHGPDGAPRRHPRCAARAVDPAAATRRPVVMVIEDLHWVDEKSEEALAALVDVIASARVLMVLTYRPGYTHSLGDRAYYSRIALQSLPGRRERRAARRRAATQRHARRKSGASSPAKAEGNPFFIEEVTKSLVESGTRAQLQRHAHARPRRRRCPIPETVAGGDPHPHRPAGPRRARGDPARVGDRPRVHRPAARPHLGGADRGSKACSAS